MYYKAKLNWSEIDTKVEILAKHGGLIQPGTTAPYIDNATKPTKNFTSPGYRECGSGSVWLVEVGRHAYPHDDNLEYDIAVNYGKLDGAWGETASYGFVKYAFVDDARTRIQTMGMAYAADIRMKPKASFVPLIKFEPYYRRLQDEYNGNVDMFARRLAMDKHDEYRKFGVLRSVLFHEYLHFRLAQMDGKLRYPDLRKKVGQLPAASDDNAAVDALQSAVEQVFDGWRGWITYKPSENDHVFIWEEEFKYLVRIFEREIVGK